MSAEIIDGKAIAARLRRQVRAEVEELVSAGRRPYLAALQVGEPPASKVYVGSQKSHCEAVGIRYALETLDEDILPSTLEERIAALNADDEVTGIILQMPLPERFDARRLQCLIDPHKDVEGLHPAHLGQLMKGNLSLGPCTALAAFDLILSTGVPIEGADAVIVGHSEIVGKPLAVMLLGMNATVTVTHVFTRDLARHTREADLLVVAAGRSQKAWLSYKRALDRGEDPPAPDLSPLITGRMIRPGAVVIDVATNRIPAELPEPGSSRKVKTVTVGDVDFESARAVASHISPVPGGVGPVTVAMLLRNTVLCARLPEIRKR